MCSHFGWTIEELYSTPFSDLDMFIKIMNLEEQFKQQEMNKQKQSKYGKR